MYKNTLTEKIKYNINIEIYRYYISRYAIQNVIQIII